MNAPARIVASIAVLAGVFVLGYWTGIRNRGVPSLADSFLSTPLEAPARLPERASDAVGQARVAVTRVGETDGIAPQAEPTLVSSPTPSSATRGRPYPHLSREWIHDYGRAIKAVWDPKLNPDQRELDEGCLKQLEAMVNDGRAHVRQLEDERDTAISAFLDWKQSHGLVGKTTPRPGVMRIRERSTSSMKQAVGQPGVVVTVDAGESSEVDAAWRAFEEGRDAYERGVREFIATCGG